MEKSRAAWPRPDQTALNGKPLLLSRTSCSPTLGSPTVARKRIDFFLKKWAEEKGRHPVATGFLSILSHALLCRTLVPNGVTAQLARSRAGKGAVWGQLMGSGPRLRVSRCGSLPKAAVLEGERLRQRGPSQTGCSCLQILTLKRTVRRGLIQPHRWRNAKRFSALPGLGRVTRFRHIHPGLQPHRLNLQRRLSRWLPYLQDVALPGTLLAAQGYFQLVLQGPVLLQELRGGLLALLQLQEGTRRRLVKTQQRHTEEAERYAGAPPPPPPRICTFNYSWIRGAALRLCPHSRVCVSTVSAGVPSSSQAKLSPN